MSHGFERLGQGRMQCQRFLECLIRVAVGDGDDVTDWSVNWFYVQSGTPTGCSKQFVSCYLRCWSQVWRESLVKGHSKRRRVPHLCIHFLFAPRNVVSISASVSVTAASPSRLCDVCFSFACVQAQVRCLLIRTAHSFSDGTQLTSVTRLALILLSHWTSAN